jgi:hypothetical protein
VGRSLKPPPILPVVDFSTWEAYFKLALEGTATSMSTAASVVRQADEVARLAVLKVQERRLLQSAKS